MSSLKLVESCQKAATAFVADEVPLSPSVVFSPCFVFCLMFN